MAHSINNKIGDTSQFIEQIIDSLTFEPISQDLLEKVSTNIYGNAAHYKCLFIGSKIDTMREILCSIENALDHTMACKINQYITSNPEVGISKKIHHALMSRIYGTGMNNLMYRNILKTYAHPRYQVLRLKNAWKTSDTIWHQIGATDTDFNYYSKRIILTAIYVSTLIYYMSSLNIQKIDLDNFITNAIKSITSTAKAIKCIKAKHV
jgi:rpsU-divergently transcribed protein